MSKFKRGVPFCACGCGEKVKWGKKHKRWNKYMCGHATKGKDKYKIEREKESPLCKCGCGEQVKWNNYIGKWAKFIQGHNGRVFTQKTKDKMRDSHLSKKLSQETINKMLKSRGRYVVAQETKDKISNANRGNKLSQEHIEKLRKANIGRIPWNKGKKCEKASEETKRKMSLAQLGEKGSNWQGGKSFELYCCAWKDKQYKSDIRDRDNNQCQNPDCKQNCNHLPLHIHHINYVKKDCRPKNLITVCCGCNCKANFKREYWQEFYQNIMVDKYNYIYHYENKKVS